MPVTMKPKSDLPVRAASGVAMIVVAGAVLWLGGLALMVLLAVIGAVAVFELVRIAQALPWRPSQRTLLMTFGAIYIAGAAAALVVFRRIGIAYALLPVLVTVATDIGAYFAGRGIGGPKIAPAISPSKTWAGLFGGMVAAGLAATIWAFFFPQHSRFAFGPMLGLFSAGAALAIVAQAGDFGESFLKRKAGVKDSGALIPGHGGVLDRIDGLLAVLVACFVGWLILSTGIE
jgi:phosphatidate cytidylyltransferase